MPQPLENLVNIPPLRPLHDNEKVFFIKNNDPQSSKVPNDVKEKRDLLLKSIQRNIYIFDDSNFEFKFPESKFEPLPKGERNQMKFEFKIEEQEEDTFKPRLNETQLAQIRQKGEFEVQSSKEKAAIPYVWKINDKLLRGRVNIVQIWQNGIATCYGLFQKSLSYMIMTVNYQLSSLAKIPERLFAVLFGKKSMISAYTPDYEFEVLKDFWNDIFSNELKNIDDQIGHEFLVLLHTEFQPLVLEEDSLQERYDNSAQKNEEIRMKKKKIQEYRQKVRKVEQFLNRLQSIQNDFENNWAKVRKRVFSRIQSEVTASYEEKQNSNEQSMLRDHQKQKDQIQQQIIQQAKKQKFLLYTAHMEKNLKKQNLSLQAIKAFTSLLIVIQIVESSFEEKAKKLSEIYQKSKEFVKGKYPIRSRNNNFLNKETDKLYKPIADNINKQFFANIFNNEELKEHVPEHYMSVFEKYKSFRKNYTTLLNEKKNSLPAIEKAERTFLTTYRLLPPFEIVQLNNLHGYAYSTKGLKRTKELSIDTSTDFWKFKLYWMRMKSWTINCAVSLVEFAWVGPFGIRCLFGTEDFVYDEYYIASENAKNYLKRKTMIGHFLKVIQGVKKSRQHFESLPDRGLFGKNFSRIFNYLECYLFRLILVGIIGTLAIYPILIILLSGFSVVLALTVWIWVPLVMVVCYLFNILIFQFESNKIERTIKVKGVPLLLILIALAVSLLLITFSVANFLLFTPIINAIYFTFLLLQRGIRTVTDAIMFLLIAKIGRTPSRDTAIAKKISGPGLSRNHFFSILEDDVYVLTQSCLEQILLQKFVSETRAKITQVCNYDEMIKFVLKPFNAYSGHIKGDFIVRENKERVINNLEFAYTDFLYRYPENPYGVRFTQEEIEMYFENSIKIVKNFVQKEAIKDWIFDDRNILFEDYEELTRSVWIQIFNCGESIFEPLEDLDKRFEFSNMASTKKNIWRSKANSVMQSLKGEVELERRIVKLSPVKKSLMANDRKIQHVWKIKTLHYAYENSCSSIYLNDSENFTFLFVAPRYLEEIEKKNQIRMNKAKERKYYFYV